MPRPAPTIAPSLLALALTLAASMASAGGPRLDDDGGFARAEPDPEASARYASAARYSERTNGRALLVIEGDAIVFEAYHHGHARDLAWPIWSGTKSFACALMLAAEDKKLVDLAEPVGDTLPEIAAHPVARAMTVRDTLAFTTGLEDDASVLTTDWLRERQRVDDKVRWTLARVAQLQRHLPGAHYQYVSSHLVLFTALMQRKLGEDPVAWLDRHVLSPIGFRYTSWLRDPSGTPAFAFGVSTTARSWARFGALVRDDGVFRGRRVLPAGGFARCFQGSAAMPAYGLTWWLNAPIPADKRRLLPRALGGYARDGEALLPGGPPDLVAAAGYKDNRLYVIPSRGLVVVRLGDGHAGFRDPELLGRLLGPR